MYYNGNDWQRRWVTGVYFQDTWALSASEGFVVADSGRFYKFNSVSGLSEITTPTNNKLNGVWGSAADKVYAVGNKGTILYYNGLDCIEVTNSASQDLNAVWGSGPQDIYAAGDSGTIVHYNGTDWSIISAGQYSMDFQDIWGFAHNNIYFAGSDGLVHYDGNNWSINPNNQFYINLLILIMIGILVNYLITRK